MVMDINSDDSSSSRKIHALDSDGSTTSSTVISNCSSSSSSSSADGSGEFYTASSHNGCFFLAGSCDEIILQFVSDLDSADIDEQKRAAMEIRLLTKNKPSDRIKIVRAGAVRPLISLISSPDPQLQEYGVSAIFNLLLCEASKDEIALAGAVNPLVAALGSGSTSTARENAASALLQLSEAEEGNKAEIGLSGAIPALVNLLMTGSFRGKKDACTALYSLCSVNENKVRAVQAGVMKPLVELMEDSESKMVDKSAFVLSLLVLEVEARAALVKEGGVPVLVEALESGTARQKEVAAEILLQLCKDPSGAYHNTVVGEGVIPPLVELAHTGGTRGARHKAGSLLRVLRQRQPQPDTSYLAIQEITKIE